MTHATILSNLCDGLYFCLGAGFGVYMITDDAVLATSKVFAIAIGWLLGTLLGVLLIIAWNGLDRGRRTP